MDVFTEFLNFEVLYNIEKNDIICILNLFPLL